MSEQVVAPSAPVESAPSEAPQQQSQSSSPAEMQDQVAQAIEQGASPQQVKNMIKEFKLKVNGKEVVKKIDLSDEKALMQELQLSEANKLGMSKARELEKLFEKEIMRLKSSPWEVLQELGHDPYALSEQKLNEWVEQQKKSPQQIEFEKMQKELAEARQRETERKEELERIKYEKLKDQATREIQQDIETALAGNPQLPKSNKTISRIVDALDWAYNNGFPEATVKDVLKLVEDDIKKETQEFFSNMNEDMFESYMGQKNIERMRKRRLAQMKKEAATSASEVKPVSMPKAKEPGEKVRAQDFFKNLKG